jgi:uncharacterized Fe-S cluster-containing radical SAM superfamily protein
MKNYIDADRAAKALREKLIDVRRERVLFSRIAGSEQENDLKRPPNCGGFGRIRHFRRTSDTAWVSDPLPNDPACAALGLATEDLTYAQVFQTAGCNFRCWYCFVPPSLLAGNPSYGAWFSAGDLLDLHLKEQFRPSVIDLSGGEPGLTPELVVWFMKALHARQLDTSTYLWTDDNLSTDFYWRCLSESDRELVSAYRNFGKVCCFKGFSADSFTFNTHASPELFERQFTLMSRWLQEGVDLYAYCTFTSPSEQNIGNDMCRFVDRLQLLSPNLPLRTVPLRIVEFSPGKRNLDPAHTGAMKHQWQAIEAWQREIESRFSETERSMNIASVRLS